MEEEGKERIRIKPLLKREEREPIIEQMTAMSTFTMECCRNAVLWIEHLWATNPGVDVIANQAYSAVRLAGDLKTTPDAVAESWAKILGKVKKAEGADETEP